MDVEVRSVNARFLELKIRHPFGGAAEQQIRSQVTERIGRGRVDLTVSLRRNTRDEQDDALAHWGIELESVRGLLSTLAQIDVISAREQLEVSSPNTLEILRFLLSSSGAHSDASPTPPPFLGELVDEAIGQLLEFRTREGEALERALRDLAHTLAQEVEQIQATLPGERERLLVRLEERMASLGMGLAGSVDPDRLRQEVAILVAKGDIEEELARVASHLDQLLQTLAAPAAKGQGKTLDFLSQELHREVTTIGSKVTSHDGSRLVIAARGTVERIREQVQNVE